MEQIRSNVDAHNFRARGVTENAWIDKENKVYGNTFEISGDVACNYIFYLTDSNNHFFSGELLFLTKPNYDSLQPVLEFIQSDIKHLIETFRWEDSLIMQKQESL
jgi:gliding motility-associated lipoprotein GldD